MKRIFFLGVFLLSSCTSFQTVISSPEIIGTGNVHGYYDSESKIFYQVTNDENNLYIKLITSDKSSIMKIFRNGLTVYFDPTGKKKKNIYFNYPLANKDQRAKQNMQYQMTKGQRPEFQLKDLLDNLSFEAIYYHSGMMEKMPVIASNTDIRVNIEILNENELNYDLIIPFNRITEEGRTGLSSLSIGLVSGKVEMPSIGSRPGGGGGGSKQGGSGRMPGGMDPSTIITQIDLWLKVELHEAE